MSYFTPTPWRIGAIESGMVAIDGANGEEVTGFVSPEDGRLIAAAPDLLDALQNIAEYWNQDQNEAAMADACWHAIHTARAAIAKATGERP